MIHHLQAEDSHNGNAQVRLQCEEPCIATQALTSNGWSIRRIVLNHKLAIYETIAPPDPTWPELMCTFSCVLAPGNVLAFELHSAAPTGPAVVTVQTIELDQLEANVGLINTVNYLDSLRANQRRAAETSAARPQRNVARKIRYGALDAKKKESK